MKKEPSIIQAACIHVARFRELYEKYSKKITVAGRGQSNLSNYARQLAKVGMLACARKNETWHWA